VQFCTTIFTSCKNADEIWLFATFESFDSTIVARSRDGLAPAIARTTALDAAAFAPRKKLCTGPLYGRVGGLAEAQNVRISANRFAAAASPARARRSAAPRRERFAIPFSTWREAATRLRSPRKRGAEPGGSAADLLLEKLVDGLRIGLAA